MDTSWSAAPKFLASPTPGCGHADLGKLAALAMAGKRHFAPARAGPMKYMLMICDDESVVLSPAEVHALPQIQAWDAEVDTRGIRRGGARLRPSSDATTVRVRDGELLVSDGPFAETKEQMGGFDIIECASLDEAVEIAARHPAAASGAIEVRPLWQE